MVSDTYLRAELPWNRKACLVVTLDSAQWPHQGECPPSGQPDPYLSQSTGKEKTKHSVWIHLAAAHLENLTHLVILLLCFQLAPPPHSPQFLLGSGFIISSWALLPLVFAPLIHTPCCCLGNRP